jgi:predicted ribosome quality control (RQC) complex YloA/Tae2 family protein
VNQETIAGIVEEIEPVLSGRSIGKIFQLSPVSLAMDFGLRGNRYLFISADPGNPRIYLIARRVSELERQSSALSPLVQIMRSSLGGAKLLSIRKDDTDRIVRFMLLAKDETGQSHKRLLIAQLTGRSANLFLTDESGRILQTLRHAKGECQRAGEQYAAPSAQANRIAEEPPLQKGSLKSLSDAADNYYKQLDAARAFASRAAASRARLRKEIQRRRELQKTLAKDLEAHGDAAQHKRIGDLLLANLATAERNGSRVKITDYYAEGTPTIEIEVDEHSSLQEESARHFARFSKAKRAAKQIAGRLISLETEIRALEEQQVQLEKIVASRDEGALETLAQGKQAVIGLAKKVRQEKIPGARRYRSSDGYEVLVGRKATDNDRLTFRVARPNDLWLHAADYPGSHVIIRNHARSDVPHRTIIEAAQLAAKFSQAGDDSKVVVHYTQRKFLSKPKGAAPGLVRMSSFRSITVAPKEAVERI